MPSSPLWADIALANGEALLPVLESFIDELRTLTGWLREGRGEPLGQRLARAQEARTDLAPGEPNPLHSRPFALFAVPSVVQPPTG